ncbi:MAG: hypothetical protein JWQ09_944 [Segetibacter sp.]|nr:hypothetical protein [Segetibacter sp.]
MTFQDAVKLRVSAKEQSKITDIVTGLELRLYVVPNEKEDYRRFRTEFFVKNGNIDDGVALKHSTNNDFLVKYIGTIDGVIYHDEIYQPT